MGLTVLPSSLDEVLSVAVALSRPLLEHLHCLVVTLGAHGVLLCGEHDTGSVNLQPRKQKNVRAAYIHTGMVMMMTIAMTVTVNMMFIASVFAEEEALCSSLPSADCDRRRDNECLRSRR